VVWVGVSVAVAVAVHAGLLFLLTESFFSSSGLQIRVRYCQVVDCFYVRRRGSQVLDAGCEAFCSGEQEVLGEGFLRFGGVGGGEEAF
jgi:hypothetical protein